MAWWTINDAKGYWKWKWTCSNNHDSLFDAYDVITNGLITGGKDYDGVMTYTYTYSDIEMRCISHTILYEN